jgi:hypothetical protein
MYMNYVYESEISLHLGCRTGYPGEHSDSMRAGRSEDWILVGRYFLQRSRAALVLHPSTYTLGTLSFLRIKRPGVALTTHPIQHWSFWKREALLLSPLPLCVFMAYYTVNFLYLEHGYAFKLVQNVVFESTIKIFRREENLRLYKTELFDKMKVNIPLMGS